MERHKEEQALKAHNLKDSLQSILPPDETIVAAVAGGISSLHMSDSSIDTRFGSISTPKEKPIYHGYGMFAATNKRFIMYQNKKQGDNLRVLSYDSIAAVEVKGPGTLTNGSVIISADEKLCIHHTEDQNAAVEPFVNHLRSKQADSAQSSTPKSSLSQAAPDIASQIQSLAALKDQGLLTEEEFNAKKQELLERL